MNGFCLPYDIYDGVPNFIAFDVHYMLIPSVTDLEEVQAVVHKSTLFCRNAMSNLGHGVIYHRLQLELFYIVEGKAYFRSLQMSQISTCNSKATVFVLIMMCATDLVSLTSRKLYHPEVVSRRRRLLLTYTICNILALDSSHTGRQRYNNTLLAGLEWHLHS